MSVKPYQIQVAQSVLDDLKQRLQSNRFPDDVNTWDEGANSAYLREIAAYWQNQFDWRKQEAELNQFNWFTADIDGEEIRFIHQRGTGANPTPIVLFHGWPDSVLRYTKLIPMLTDPAKYGGDPNDSFDVIVPDMIAPTKNGTVRTREQWFKQFAEQYWKLMTRELGYTRFAASGGDAGSPLAQILAVEHPESMIGIHLTDVGFSATMMQHDDLSEVEQEYLNDLNMRGYQEGAYAVLQGTKPQTLAISLNDSPVGLAAWIIEKIRTWSDCNGDLESIYTKDELLTNVMIYWTRGFDPRGYREEWVNGSLAGDQPITVPTALTQPAHDANPVTPREFAERNLKNLQHYEVLPRGGHFVAMEFPQLLADDLRTFFRSRR